MWNDSQLTTKLSRTLCPGSAIDKIIETAIRLLMEKGLAAAEGYLQAQGVSRLPALGLPPSDSSASLAPSF
jgi:hypothetical protein